MNKVAIIGCGNGGQALAGHFALLGIEVNIYAHPKHLGGFKEVKRRGGIECFGEVNGFGKVSLVSTDLSEVVTDAKMIFICLPVIAHESIFINMLPFLKDNQTIINLSGQFSGIYQKDILNRSSWDKNIIIVDITSFPYACRLDSPSNANIVSIKRKMGIASFNQSIAYEISCILNDFFPSELEVMSSFIEVGLYDPCGITHPSSVVFNAGRIGNNQEFYFYKDGITKETALFLEKLDNERITIGAKIGVVLPKFHEVMNSYYNLSFENIYDFYKYSPIHNKKTFFPDSIAHRYVSEDVPYSLVPWYSIGERVGYQASSMKNIIEITSIMNNINYYQKGRVISDMHLKEFHPCG